MKRKHKKVLLAVLAVATIFSLLAVSASAYQVSTLINNEPPTMTNGYWTSAIAPIDDFYTSVLGEAGSGARTQSLNVPNDFVLATKSFFTFNSDLRFGREVSNAYNNDYGTVAYTSFESFADNRGYSLSLSELPLAFDHFTDTVTFGVAGDFMNNNFSVQFGDFVATPGLLEHLFHINVYCQSEVPKFDIRMTCHYYDVLNDHWDTIVYKGTNVPIGVGQYIDSWKSPWNTNYVDVTKYSFDPISIVTSTINDRVVAGEIAGLKSPVLISNFNISSDYLYNGDGIRYTEFSNTYIRTRNPSDQDSAILQNASTIRSLLTDYYVRYVNDMHISPPSLDDVDLSAIGDSLGNAVDGFFDVEILPNVTIRLLFGSIIGILVFVAFLRYFAGG